MRDILKVAICASHPIQYHVPWYQQLSKCADIELSVYYITIPDEVEQGCGFGKSFAWDIPMLEGYQWKMLKTYKAKPQLNKFFDTRLQGLTERLRENRPDALIVSGWHTFGLIQVVFACSQLGIPKLVRGDSNSLVVRPKYKRIGHRILMKLYDAYLAVGLLNREFYVRNGAPNHRIFPCRHCVDNNRFAEQSHRLASLREEIRAKWHIPESFFCFLFCGKLEPKKRIFDVMDALDMLRKRYKGVHLLVVGSGEQTAAAKERVRRSGLPVTFAGFLNQTEVAHAYVSADCLILPSDYGETWGLVVNEAMACGLPVIVSDRVGCRSDLILEEQTGLSFPCGDIRALAHRMYVMASDREGSKQMGQRAKQLVMSEYSVEKAVEGTVDAIRSVAAV
ncbi:MAG: glycosyltransferase family 4 protein [Gammaproteobacteria bacterium]|nr:glycosyltransferase family 4 protein [Gammaproteobacteria bacterium]